MCELTPQALKRAVEAGCKVKIKTGETPTSTITIYITGHEVKQSTRKAPEVGKVF
jgi:hypothetical protein